jgi:hypothetical protein
MELISSSKGDQINRLLIIDRLLNSTEPIVIATDKFISWLIIYYRLTDMTDKGDM